MARAKKNLKHQAYWIHDNEKKQLEAENKAKQQGDPTLQANPNSNMHLVQQYVMLNGKLQPALKYKYANPMYNRYKLEN